MQGYINESIKDALIMWGNNEPSLDTLIERLDTKDTLRLMRIFNITLRRIGIHVDELVTLEKVIDTPTLHGPFMVCHAYFFT